MEKSRTKILIEETIKESEGANLNTMTPEQLIGKRVLITTNNGRRLSNIEKVSAKTGKIKCKDSDTLFDKNGSMVVGNSRMNWGTHGDLKLITPEEETILRADFKRLNLINTLAKAVHERLDLKKLSQEELDTLGALLAKAKV